MACALADGTTLVWQIKPEATVVVFRAVDTTPTCLALNDSTLYPGWESGRITTLPWRSEKACQQHLPERRDLWAFREPVVHTSIFQDHLVACSENNLLILHLGPSPLQFSLGRSTFSPSVVTSVIRVVSWGKDFVLTTAGLDSKGRLYVLGIRWAELQTCMVDWLSPGELLRVTGPEEGHDTAPRDNWLPSGLFTKLSNIRRIEEISHDGKIVARGQGWWVLLDMVTGQVEQWDDMSDLVFRHAASSDPPCSIAVTMHTGAQLDGSYLRILRERSYRLCLQADLAGWSVSRPFPLTSDRVPFSQSQLGLLPPELWPVILRKVWWSFPSLGRVADVAYSWLFTSCLKSCQSVALSSPFVGSTLSWIISPTS